MGIGSMKKAHLAMEPIKGWIFEPLEPLKAAEKRLQGMTKTGHWGHRGLDFTESGFCQISVFLRI
jgi:hypothetical protein